MLCPVKDDLGHDDDDQHQDVEVNSQPLSSHCGGDFVDGSGGLDPSPDVSRNGSSSSNSGGSGNEGPQQQYEDEMIASLRSDPDACEWLRDAFLHGDQCDDYGTDTVTSPVLLPSSSSSLPPLPPPSPPSLLLPPRRDVPLSTAYASGWKASSLLYQNFYSDPAGS